MYLQDSRLRDMARPRLTLVGADVGQSDLLLSCSKRLAQVLVANPTAASGVADVCRYSMFVIANLPGQLTSGVIVPSDAVL